MRTQEKGTKTTERTYHCSQCNYQIDRDVNARIKPKTVRCRIDREIKRLWGPIKTLYSSGRRHERRDQESHRRIVCFKEAYDFSPSEYHMFTEIDNIKVAYQVNGSGKPVVLLHGWGGEANSFKPVFDRLSASYQVYALDLPGFGLSELPPTAWAASDYARFLIVFFQKLHIKKAHLIGHSYGGRISIVMAAEVPDLVDKLILVDSAGIIPKRTFKYHIQVSIAKFGRLIRNCCSIGEKIADSLAQNVGSKDYQEAGPMRATLVKSVNQDLRPLLHKIKASTLLIWGDKDLDTPISFGEIMSEEIPNSELVILKDAGHFSYLDQFPQFCKIVSDFLG